MPTAAHLVVVHRKVRHTAAELEELQASIASEYGLKPVQQRLQIDGICKECQEKREPSHLVFDNDKVFARDALRIALATEERGVRFYKAAAEVASSPSLEKSS